MPTTRHLDRRLGCRIALTVVADDGDVAEQALAEGLARLDELDHRWSRFRPDSELCALNAAAGDGPHRVSSDTLELVAAAVDVWLATGGLVDASVLGTLERLGYDRSFDLLVPADGSPPAPASSRLAHPAARPDVAEVGERLLPPGLGGVEIDRTASTIRLPGGVRLDPGGLGKGRIADSVADAVMAVGAGGACIDLGGDVAARGTDDDGEPWVVAIEDPADAARTLADVALAEGAVATSGVQARRWRTPTGEAHHLVDPRTGRPSTSDLVTATVVAAEAMWAEVLAKAAVLAGLTEAVGLLAASGASALLVTTDGFAVRTAGFERFERAEPAGALPLRRPEDERVHDEVAGPARPTGGER